MAGLLRERARFVRLAIFGLALLTMVAPPAFAGAEPWGAAPDGSPAHLFRLQQGPVRAEFSDYGARLVGLYLPRRDGGEDNVLVGADQAAPWAGLWSVAGAMMGRYANRIGGGSFTLDGQTYALDRNQRGHTLHGGATAFNAQLWQAKPIRDGVEMRLSSADGASGFPGRMDVVMRYRLRARHGVARLSVDLRATSDKPTYANFTNHAIFNLEGAGADWRGQDLRIAASRYTPMTSDGLPDGSFAPVAGQVFDARVPVAVEKLVEKGGLDVSLALDNGGRMAPVAWLRAPQSGRSLTVYTSEPGMQLFIPARLPTVGARGGVGLCLEPQHFPDSPHQAAFPSTLLRPGQTRQWHSVYLFRYKAAVGHPPINSK
jgi:aldose 1-epimerase